MKLKQWLGMKTTKSAIMGVLTQLIRLIPASPEVRAFLVSLSDIMIMAVIAYLASNSGE